MDLELRATSWMIKWRKRRVWFDLQFFDDTLKMTADFIAKKIFWNRAWQEEYQMDIEHNL